MSDIDTVVIQSQFLSNCSKILIISCLKYTAILNMINSNFLYFEINLDISNCCLIQSGPKS